MWSSCFTGNVHLMQYQGTAVCSWSFNVIHLQNKPNKLQKVSEFNSHLQRFKIREKMTSEEKEIFSYRLAADLLEKHVTPCWGGPLLSPPQTLSRQRLLSNCCAIVFYLYTMAGWCSGVRGPGVSSKHGHRWAVCDVGKSIFVVNVMLMRKTLLNTNATLENKQLIAVLKY